MRAFLIVVLALATAGTASAQQRRSSLWGPVSPAVEIQEVEPSRFTSLVGATLGASLGTGIGLPVFIVAATGADCYPRGEEATCYLPFTPLLLGSWAGAAAGSRIAGGDAALGSSLIGSLLGTAVSAVAVIGNRETTGLSGILWITVPPIVGAIVGNQLGQTN